MSQPFAIPPTLYIWVVLQLALFFSSHQEFSSYSIRNSDFYYNLILVEIFSYKFNFRQNKVRFLRSLIDDIEELLALGKGDKYRLMDIRVRLESKKKLYISDREFLRDLVKNHLGRSMLSPEPSSRQIRSLSTTEVGADLCPNCGSNIAGNDMFCESCGT